MTTQLPEALPAPGTPVSRTRGRGQRVAPLFAKATWASLFFWSYVCSYASFLPESYDGWGLGQHVAVLSGTTLVLWILAVIPALFIRPSLSYTSDFFIYIQYFLIYVPSLWVAFNATHPDVAWEDSVAIDATLFLSMMILVLASLMRPHHPSRALEIRGPSVTVLTLVSSLMFIVVGTALGWHFNLVGFDEIYALRSEASEALVASGGAGPASYFFNWLNGALLPILFCAGLYLKSFRVCALATLLYVGLYALWGSKASLMAVPAIFVVNHLCRKFEGRHLSAFAIFFSFLLLLPYAFRLMDPELEALTDSWYLYVVHQRTFNSSALLIPQYLDFFQANPNTFGSHVTGINLLVQYPFELDVPRMVGNFQYGSMMTANVNFWGQDGIAAFGLVGVPIITVIVALVFYGMDRRLRRLPVAFCVACMTFMASNIIDTSIFTTLITGGLVLVTAILPMMFAPRRLPSSPTGPAVRSSAASIHRLP